MAIAEILVVVLLTIVNGILAGSEIAIVSSRKARLDALAERGSPGARRALKVVADPSAFLSTVQIGITLIGILAGAFSGATLAHSFGEWLNGHAWIAPNGEAIAIVVVVLAITYLSLIVGELVPKRIALGNPERIAAAVAGPMLVLSRIAAPAVWLLGKSSDLVLRLLGLSGERSQVVTEEEVRSLVAEGTEAGVFTVQEREMIDGVLRLADRSVRAIMTPRSDIAWIDADADIAEAFRRLRDERYSHLLVCDGRWTGRSA